MGERGKIKDTGEPHMALRDVLCSPWSCPSLLAGTGFHSIPSVPSPTSGIKKRKMKQNKNPLLKQRTWSCSGSCDSQKCYWRFKSLPRASGLPGDKANLVSAILTSSRTEQYFYSSFSFSIRMSTTALPYFCSPQTHPSVLHSPFSPSSRGDAHCWQVPQWKLWVLTAINFSFANSLLLMLP